MSSKWHRFVISAPVADEDIQTVIDWLEENALGRWKVRYWWPGRGRSFRDVITNKWCFGQAIFKVKNGRDAALLKMWHHELFEPKTISFLPHQQNVLSQFIPPLIPPLFPPSPKCDSFQRYKSFFFTQGIRDGKPVMLKLPTSIRKKILDDLAQTGN